MMKSTKKYKMMRQDQKRQFAPDFPCACFLILVPTLTTPRARRPPAHPSTPTYSSQIQNIIWGQPSIRFLRSVVVHLARISAQTGNFGTASKMRNKGVPKVPSFSFRGPSRWGPRFPDSGGGEDMWIWDHVVVRPRARSPPNKPTPICKCHAGRFYSRPLPKPRNAKSHPRVDAHATHLCQHRASPAEGSTVEMEDHCPPWK